MTATASEGDVMLEAPKSTFRPTIGRVLACVAAATVLTLAMTAGARAAGPGTLDTSFGSGGIASVGTGTRLLGAVVQSDGKLLAVGQSGVGGTSNLLLARFTSSGALDSSFGSGGLVQGPAIAAGQGSIGRAVAVQANGQIVVVGSATDSSGAYPHGLIVERYNSNGSLDTSFGSHGVADELSGLSAGDGYAVAIQPDGRIVATGAANAAGSGGVTPRVAVVRLNSNGSLDSGFGSGGQDVLDLGAYSYALAVALQSNGSIVLGGSQAPGLQVPNALIARLTSSGALDTSFAGTGAYAHQYAQGAANSAFNAVAVQPNGEIVAAGAATMGNTGADAFVVRFTSGGSQDGSFGSGGVAYTPSAINFTASGTTVPGASGMTIAPNGDIVAAGTSVNGVQTSATVWAFKPNGSLDSSFGSGGIAMLTSHGLSAYAAVAISPTNGDLLAAGDQGQPATTSDTGIAGRYIGFGAPPPAGLKLSLSGVHKSYKTSTVAKHGLKFKVSCNEACKVTATLTISAKTAKALHLKVHGKGPFKLASAKATLGGSGSKSITLKLTKSIAKALETQKSIRITLTLTAANKTITKTVTFKR
jgi:uncharacterized delta-60 repeat protein